MYRPNHCALQRDTPIQYPCCSRERLWVVEDLKGRHRNGRMNEWIINSNLQSLEWVAKTSEGCNNAPLRGTGVRVNKITVVSVKEMVLSMNIAWVPVTRISQIALEKKKACTHRPIETQCKHYRQDAVMSDRRKRLSLMAIQSQSYYVVRRSQGATERLDCIPSVQVYWENAELLQD